MAQRGREGMNKRVREKARQDRQEAKRQRRAERSEQPAADSERDETALMEEFRRLSERYAAKLVTEGHYLEERHRILVELGIEADDEA